MKKKYTIPFNKIDLQDIELVGGKNASLGEMIQKLSTKGIKIPDGFAISSLSYWDFLDANNIRGELSEILGRFNDEHFSDIAAELKVLKEISQKVRALILKSNIPSPIEKEIRRAYRELALRTEQNVAVAVRSSATAEDLPNASFAGQQESFLNISGEEALLLACRKCFASLFTQRAIKYRKDHGFEHMNVALSIGIQQMVRADKGCSGVAFTLEPDSGFKDVIVINGIWGLGENIVKGEVDPDEFIVFKPSLKKEKKCIISRKIGKKQKTMIYSTSLNHLAKSTTTNINTPAQLQEEYVLNDAEVKKLAEWSMLIEEHYQLPMDIEWAKDGISKQLYILQARPETVYSIKEDPHILYNYKLQEKGEVLTRGIGLGNKIASGKARILKTPNDAVKLKKGEVLVTDITNPDWEPIMKRMAALITNKGGRTSHAAIVARELGAVAVVGTANATEVIEDGQQITVSCAEGKNGIIYKGSLAWKKEAIDSRKIKLPRTKIMFILADPDKAFQYSFLPNNGIGLMRIEFVMSNSIQIHPMALVKFNELRDENVKSRIENITKGYLHKEDYFIDQLSQAVGTVAAAFYPKDVIVRMSDLKSNEYRNLIGGEQFEPEEENPMMGFRGASRYYNSLYKEGFRLECEAMKIVRNEMGLKNIKLMIPFCRTPEEGRKVVELMSEFGLKRKSKLEGNKEKGVDIYTMIELPSNVILAEEFAKIFDGFSIGSNDLTQLTLGIDRDSALVHSLFDENNEAVKKLIIQVIQTAQKTKTKIGLCGQAPSDFPEFAQFLVKEGIDSISLNPDALMKCIENIHKAEKKLNKRDQLKTNKVKR